MFREMRRNTKELPREEAEKMLGSLTYGTLAVLGDNDYPYAVPVSFAYERDAIYFHGAIAGQKYESLEKCDKVSFSVVEKDDIKPDKFTTHFKSAIAFGRAARLTEKKDVEHAMELLLQKYSPGFMEKGRDYVAKAWGRFAAYRLTIEHLTAKGVE